MAKFAIIKIGIKAKPQRTAKESMASLPLSKLESRQSARQGAERHPRQFAIIKIGIKAKRAHRWGRLREEFAIIKNGIKAKPRANDAGTAWSLPLSKLESRQSAAWLRTVPEVEFAIIKIGIKAKPRP